jgi:hypothetical protein
MNGGADAEEANPLAPVIPRGGRRRGCRRETGSKTRRWRQTGVSDCARRRQPGAPFIKTKSKKRTAMTKKYCRHGDCYVVDKSGVHRTTYFLGPKNNPRKTTVRQTTHERRPRSLLLTAMSIFNRFQKNN